MNQTKSDPNSATDNPTAVLVAEYLDYLGQRKNRSELTLDSYKNDLDQLAAFLADGANNPPDIDIRILALNADEAVRFTDSLKAQYTPSTLNRKVTAIRGFYGYLVSIQKLSVNPFDGVNTRPPETTEVEYLEEAHLQQLFDVITGSHWLAFRDRAIVAVLYSTGMRVGELLGLSLDDIDAESSAVFIRTHGKATRQCPLPTWAWSTLERYIDRRPVNETEENAAPSRVLFVNRNVHGLTARSVRRKLCEYSRRAGLPVEATPAVLRHSCAIHMLRRGADVKTVRELLGHLSTSSMRPYLNCLAEHPEQTAPIDHPVEITAF